jgi:hypothetical protein
MEKNGHKIITLDFCFTAMWIKLCPTGLHKSRNCFMVKSCSSQDKENILQIFLNLNRIKKKIPEIWIKSEDDDDDKSSQRDILKK